MTAPPKPTPEPRRQAIALRKVRKSYRSAGTGRVSALELDALDLPVGGRLVVAGPNGSGKSTLMHIVSGLLRPDEGQVEVLGLDLRRLSEVQLDRFRARSIGYLLQGGQLLEGLSAEENVMVPMMLASVPAREQQQRTRALLERFGVAHRARHRPGALSGGERQRVAMARALANDPELLLVDEPLAGLDRKAVERIVGVLSEIAEQEERAVVVVTHRPELLAERFEVLELAAPASQRKEER